MTRQARYGGAEGDENPLAGDTTSRRWQDNAVVEEDLIRESRKILKRCIERIQSMKNPTPVKVEAAWLPFTQWCDLCMSVETENQSVDYMGKTIDNFPYPYGNSSATQTRFIQHILPRIVGGIALPPNVKVPTYRKA